MRRLWPILQAADLSLLRKGMAENPNDHFEDGEDGEAKSHPYSHIPGPGPGVGA